MDVLSLLRSRRAEIDREIKRLNDELHEIDVAVQAVMDAKRKPSAGTVQRTMTIDDAIVEAVKHGRKAPSEIHVYLKQELNINTTISSVRTRVSRLKTIGRIARDPTGWVMPAAKGASTATAIDAPDFADEDEQTSERTSSS